VPLVVLLENGERHRGRFLRSSADDLTLLLGSENGLRPSRELTLSKLQISRVTSADPRRGRAMVGALIGGGAMAAWMKAAAAACGLGCENDIPPAAPLGAAGLGAAVGSLVGYWSGGRAMPRQLFPPADSPGRPPAPLNRHFPAGPQPRIGATFTQTTFRSALLEGRAAAPGFVLAVQLFRSVSAHIEYSATRGQFTARPGAVSTDILMNVVPAANRSAGWERGIAGRRVRWVFSELVGVQPPPIGRLRFELLGGLGVQAQEDRNYYDAFPPGKYKVLNFESPESGFVLGVDAEIAAAPNLVVVPMFRYNQMGDPGPSLVYGVGAHWRF
jgi:hypothetical protein